MLVPLALSGACGGEPRVAQRGAGRSAASGPPRDTATVYIAASLTRPLQGALDAWGAAHGVAVLLESGGSLEHARKITELHRDPDLLLLADWEVFPQFLAPAHTAWWATFARNRMVVAFTPRSRHAAEIDSLNWTRILAQPDVEVGRTDPAAAPVGYRTLLMLQLAERYYRQPGLAAKLVANAPPRNMRANAADLAALLQLGELDYIYDYESVATTYGLRSISLPSAIDLGDAEHTDDYRAAQVRVAAKGGSDSVTVQGSPILYALSVPLGAPHQRIGEQLAAWLLSAEGRAAMRRAGVDALERPEVHGDAPAAVRAVAR